MKNEILVQKYWIHLSSLRFLPSMHEALINRGVLHFLQHPGMGFVSQNKAKRSHLSKCRSKGQREI